MTDFSQVSPDKLCEELQLCSVRKHNWFYMVAVKLINGETYDIPFEKLVNQTTYENVPIVRTYASWHILFSEDKSKVYLVCVENKNTRQWQFTWWSPLEEQNMDVVKIDNWIVKFHLGKIEENALIRIRNRLDIDVVENYVDMPLVDRVLMEGKDDDAGRYRKLVYLLHFVGKSYAWNIVPQIWVEKVVWWDWVSVSDILENKKEMVAPNVWLIVERALTYIV